MPEKALPNNSPVYPDHSAQTIPVVLLTTFRNSGDSPRSPANDDQSFADSGRPIAGLPVTNL